jgi:hypothetical protein
MDTSGGKTWSLAIFIATMLICVPHVTIAFFAKNKYRADATIRLIYDFVEAHPAGSTMIRRSDGGRITLVDPAGEGKGTDARTLTAYPNAYESARGYLAVQTYIDDGASMGEKPFKEFIMPTMANKDSCLNIMVGTPLGEENFMAWLILLKNPVTLDGLLFKSITLDAACDPCVATATAAMATATATRIASMP